MSRFVSARGGWPPGLCPLCARFGQSSLPRSIGQNRPQRTFVLANASVRCRRLRSAFRAQCEPLVDDRTSIEEEPENQRTSGTHYCGKYKGCRVGSGDVNEPTGHSDAAGVPPGSKCFISAES